jgi:hypothetical protein
MSVTSLFFLSLGKFLPFLIFILIPFFEFGFIQIWAVSTTVTTYLTHPLPVLSPLISFSHSLLHYFVSLYSFIIMKVKVVCKVNVSHCPIHTLRVLFPWSVFPRILGMLVVLDWIIISWMIVSLGWGQSCHHQPQSQMVIVSCHIILCPITSFNCSLTSFHCPCTSFHCNIFQSSYTCSPRSKSLSLNIE